MMSGGFPPVVKPQQAVEDASVLLDEYMETDAAEVVKMSGHDFTDEARKFIRNKT